MNAPQQVVISPDAEQKMQEALKLQRESYLAEGFVSLDVRKDRIDRAIDILVRHAERISDALNEDFVCRPRSVNMMTDVAGSIGSLKHCKKHMAKWMKPEKRPTLFPLNLLGGRSHIEYQPKGVVGIVAPWNFPVSMVFQPLAGILSAGNRAMVKPSEFTPITSDLIAEIIAEGFDPAEVTTVTGGPEVGQAFTSLPFDHMIFTGATSIARHVLASAARNLVPVTLELGGKSPVVISRTADLAQALERIMLGKTLNAGQICLAPDYLMVPEEKLDEVVSLATKAVGAMYPTLLANDDYTAVINERHNARLSSYLADAAERGHRVVPINPANENFEGNAAGKIPPTLIVSPDVEAKCMQEEIFGPLLPIRTYKDFEETIAHINANPRPLAAYYFGKDAAEEEAILKRTTSGGVCINDVIMHIMQEDMPFGGVGPSGMGSYHGVEGFKTFSHAKSVYSQTTRFNVGKLAGLLPPYGKATETSIKSALKK
jgi:coniferyl-aldehyde dehydrogenase